jgi:RNA exonuclease 4
MVGVGTNGTEDALARVSIVNYYGNVLLDTFVSPTQRVTDWRTKHSGIRPADVLNSEGIAPEIMLNLAKSFDVVQKEVMELLKDRVIVGHALKGDLAALKLSHPRYCIRDTSSFEPFRTKYGSGRTPSLKKIVQGELGVDIQISEHDSVSPY